MNNKTVIINEICNSPFIDQFILSLKDNEILFSVNDNFKRPIEIEKGKYQAEAWQGLLIIYHYSKKKELNNADTNQFINQLLNSTIDFLLSDEEINAYKRYSSNYSVMTMLLMIIASKTEYIDNTRFIDFMREYLASPLTDKDIIGEIIIRNSNEFLNAKSNIFFDIHNLILEDSEVDSGFYKYMGNHIASFIEKIPYNYFMVSKTWLEKTKPYFFFMGSIEEYSRKTKSYIEKEDVYLDWFKQSAKYINVDIISEIIKEYLNGKKELLNKLAVFLLSIRFPEMEELFYLNLEKIIENHLVYSDLRCLLEKNIDNISSANKKKIVTCILNSKIDVENAYISKVLKNRLLMIIGMSGYECDYRKENEKECALIENYNKKVSVSFRDSEDDVTSFRKQIEGKSFEKIIEEYYGENNKSLYYRDVINKSIYLLIKEENINVVEKADIIPYELSTYILGQLVENKQYDILTEYLSKYINRDQFEDESLKTILSAFQGLYKYDENNFELFIDFDYKKIKYYRKRDERLSSVTIIINENVYEYLDLLSLIAEQHDEAKERLIEALEYYKTYEEEWKTKAIMGFIFPRLWIIDKNYALENKEYIFNNNTLGINPSYHMLSFWNGLSIDMFGSIVNSDSFLCFFEEPESSTEDNLKCKNRMMCRSVSYYINSGKSYETIKRIIDINYKNCARHLFKQLALDFDNKKKTVCSRIETIITYVNDENLFSQLGEKYNCDQLSREIANLIIISNNKYVGLWSLLKQSFTHYNHFFADEMISLVEKYKIQEEKNIKIILDIYFGKYKIYRTYEATLIKVYNLIKNEPSYKKEAKKWKVSVTKENPDLEL